MGATYDNAIVILRAGDAIGSVAARRGEFASWITEAIRPVWAGEIREVDVRQTAPSSELLSAAGLIVTGSPASVTQRVPWMLASEAFLARAVHDLRPVLGICFGHQLLAQALGGEVIQNPRGWEVGTITIRALAVDPLFEGLSSSFTANATHVDTVGTVPPGATVIAESDRDAAAAFAIHRARGVQFHPEIDGDVMRGYLDARRVAWRNEGLDVAGLHREAADTPSGAMILQNFVRHFL